MVDFAIPIWDANPLIVAADWGDGHHFPSHLFEGLGRPHLVSIMAVMEVQQTMAQKFGPKKHLRFG